MVGRPAQVLLLACSLALACRGDSDPIKRRDPTTLVVVQGAAPQSLDPLRATDNESIAFGAVVFEGLVRWRPGTLEIEPGLAEQWQVAPDRLSWTFELRRGVVFHDGSPFDADAVVFSFERVIDPSHPNYLGADATYWRSLISSVTKVTAVNPTTVRIALSGPYTPLLSNLVLFPIVSPAAVRRFGDRFRDHPVGSGPFQFEGAKMGEYVTVTRHDRYWGPRPAVSRIVFRVIGDARQRLVELESGAADLAQQISSDELSFVDLHPALTLHTAPGNNVTYLAFNLERRGFRDVRVRRAVAHAIDRDPIVKLAYQGHAVEADSPLPPSDWAHYTSPNRAAFDRRLARRLIEEAIADGAFDRNATYSLYVPATSRVYMPQPVRVARLIQAALAQLGIRTELVLQPYQEHRESLRKGSHDLALFGWVGDNGDPDNFLYVLFDSDKTLPPNAQNFAYYRNHEVDRLLRAAQAATDQGTRRDLYRTIQDQLASELPSIPLVHSEYVIAASAVLDQVVVSPLGQPIYSLIRRRGTPP